MKHFEKRQKFVFTFLYTAAVALLFGSYPIALLPPGLKSASYFVQLPSLFILSLIAIIAIFYCRFEWKHAFFVPAIIYSGLALYHCVASPLTLFSTLEFLGYVSIPLAFSLLPQVNDNFKRALNAPLAGLWLLLVVYGAIDLILGYEVVGITGNRNWMAISLISTTPWCIYVLRNRLSTSDFCRHYAYPASLLVTLPPVLWLLYKCESRAAWLALAAYIGLDRIYRLKLAWRLFALTAVAICGIVIVSIAPRLVIRAYLADIRGPTWISTSKLILDHPLFGVGPGNYAKAHTVYRAQSDYHRRLVATDRTSHPHNEFLNIAANLGLPAAAMWLLLLYPLIVNIRRSSGIDRMANFSAFVVICHAMLDKALVQPPSSIIGLLCLGWNWRPYLRYRPGVPAYLKRPAIRIVTGLCVTVMVIAISYRSWRDIRVGWHRRLAALYKTRHQYSQAFHEYRKVTDIAPDEIRGWYGAGAIAVQYLMQPGTALPYLHEVIEIDPNYAHLNRLLGKAYGTLGDHHAASFYFARECALFSRDTIAYHNYFLSLFRLGEDEKMRRVYDHVRQLYIDIAALNRSEAETNAMIRRWLDAVRADQSALAIQIAGKLCRNIDTSFVDPGVHSLFNVAEWDPEFLYSPFNEADFRYWQALLIREEILDSIPRRGDSSAPSAGRSLEIVDFVAKKIEWRQSPDLFQLPADVWASGSGTRSSIGALTTWLTNFGGELRVLFMDNTASPATASYIVFDGDKWRQINQTLLFADDRNAVDDAPAYAERQEMDIPNISRSVRFFIYPQQFLLKNMILGVILRHYDPSLTTLDDVIPSLMIASLTEKLTPLSTPTDPENLIFPEPFELISPPIRE